MATAPAQIPTSFGHELRACLRCRLVKTYDQVLVPYYPLFFIIVFCLQFLFLFHSSESQAVRTAHSLRWKKITSVLLIALLPILMGLWYQFFFIKIPFTFESLDTHSVFLLPFDLPQDHFSYGSKSELGCPLVAHW